MLRYRAGFASSGLLAAALALPTAAADPLYIAPAPTAERPLFVEIYRQAVHVRARHECGLATADAAMRSPRGTGSLWVGVRKVQGALELRLMRGEAALGSQSAPYAAVPWDAVAEVARARNAAVRLLAPVCAAPAALSDGPDAPWAGRSDALALVERINRLAGAPPGRPGFRALSLAYAILGKKVEFLVGPYPKVFFARALAYAQAEASAEGKASQSLAFALTAAGRPGDGAALAGAARTAGAPSLGRLTRAWAERSPGLIPAQGVEIYRPAVEYVKGWLAFDGPGAAHLADLERSLKDNPDDLSAYHYLVSDSNAIGLKRRYSGAYLEAALRTNATPFPASRRDTEPSAQGFLAAIEALEKSAPASEIPGALTAFIRFDHAFDAALFRLRLLHDTLNLSDEAEALAGRLEPLLARHPAACYLPVPVSGPSARKSSTVPLVWDPGVPSGERRHNGSMMGWTDQDRAMLGKFPMSAEIEALAGVSQASCLSAFNPHILAPDIAHTWGRLSLGGAIHNLELLDDVRLDTHLALVSNEANPQRRAEFLSRVARLDPADEAALETDVLEEGASPEPILAALRRNPESLDLLRVGSKLALYGGATSRRKTIWAARKLLELDPGSKYAAQVVSGEALAAGRLDEAFNALDSLARRDDGTLEPAHALAQMGLIRLRQGRHEEALQLTATAAQAYSGHSLILFAFALERTGNLDKAEEVFDAIKQRYGPAWSEWQRRQFRLRTGHRSSDTMTDVRRYIADQANAREAFWQAEAAALSGDWQTAERLTARPLSPRQHADPEKILWHAVARLRQGIPVEQALAQAVQWAPTVKTYNSPLNPVVRAYTGKLSVEDAALDLALLPSVRSMGFYFLSELLRARGDRKGAEALLRRCYDEQAVETVQYTLAALQLGKKGR